MHVPRYAYLPPTPEVWELWKVGKALGPEYLLSPEGKEELKSETSLSALRLHVLFALASTETLNRTPNCSWLNREASLIRQTTEQMIDCLSLTSLSSLSSSSSPSTSSLDYLAFHPETNKIRDEFAPRFQHGFTHLPHLNKITTKQRVVVATLEQFQWNFQVFTQGVLAGNTRAVVCGSAALACMYLAADREYYEREVRFREQFATLALPRDIRILVASYAFHADPLMPYSTELYNALFCAYHLELEWQGCDVDVFLQVNSVAEAEDTLRKLTEGYKASLPRDESENFAVLRTHTCITLCSRWPYRNVQIVLLLFPSVCGLLSCFDLDCVRLAYSLETRAVTTLPQAARAISTGINLITPSLCVAWGRSTPHRILKYRSRGFRTALFDLWPVERSLYDWIEGYKDAPPFPGVINPTLFNPATILMPSLSYPVASLFLANQKLRSPPSKFKPIPSPESRGRYSFSSTSSWNARRGSCGSDDSVNFHVHDSPCPSPPLVPLPPSVFPTPRSQQSSPHFSPPGGYVGGTPPFYTPHSPYHPFRPPIFNLAFPPRFSPPLTPRQGFPAYSASPLTMAQRRPSFIYPPLSPFGTPLHTEQVSPHTPTHPYPPSPLKSTDQLPPLQASPSSLSAIDSPNLPSASNPALSAALATATSSTLANLSISLGEDASGEKNSVDLGDKTNEITPPTPSPPSTSTSQQGDEEKKSPEPLPNGSSPSERTSFENETKFSIVEPKGLKDFTMGDRCVMLCRSFRVLFDISLHPAIWARVMAIETMLRLSEKPSNDPRGLELPSYIPPEAWSSELQELAYGPGINTVENLPLYTSHLKEIFVPVMYSSDLEGVWNGTQEHTPETVPLLWFRWKASEYDCELVKTTLEKNI